MINSWSVAGSPKIRSAPQGWDTFEGQQEATLWDSGVLHAPHACRGESPDGEVPAVMPSVVMCAHSAGENSLSMPQVHRKSGSRSEPFLHPPSHTSCLQVKFDSRLATNCPMHR